MPRLPRLTADTARPDQQALLDETRRALGRVPNLYAAMANSPAALRGYLALRDALGDGALAPLDRELLALLVADRNGCDYCLAAHSFRGARLFHLTSEQLQRARRAETDDPHGTAVLRLAASILATGGRIEDADLAHARAAGLTYDEIGEIVGHVALNVFSNYFNHMARPELDFPAPAA